MEREFLGFGLGLRKEHYQSILDNKPQVDWFEILSENYMVSGGKPLYYLDAIRESYPMVMHGVSLSIGSTDLLNYDYLTKLKKLAERIKPHWISDHLCWTNLGGFNSHDLLPLPYTEETINHLVPRIKEVQDFLGQQILLENVSSYLTYKDSEMTEWEFISELVERADCYILLDINNIYVSSRNHNFEPMDYIKAIKPHRVKQFHLAGHLDMGEYVIDTHDNDVPGAVWELYRQALKHFGNVSTMIERDDKIFSFEALYDEMSYARKVYENSGVAV